MAQGPKEPHWLIVAIRNALVQQITAYVFAASGGLGLIALVAGIVQSLPIAQIVTYSAVSAAAGAAIVLYVRRVLVEANLATKFYVNDVQIIHAVDNTGLSVAGYIAQLQLRSLADIPIEYCIEDFSGNIDGLAMPELTAPQGNGTVQAGQDGWHSLGVLPMPPPADKFTLKGSLRLRIRYGRNANYGYVYSKRFEFHVVLDEYGNVIGTRAFHR